MNIIFAQRFKPSPMLQTETWDRPTKAIPCYISDSDLLFDFTDANEKSVYQAVFTLVHYPKMTKINAGYRNYETVCTFKQISDKKIIFKQLYSEINNTTAHFKPCHRKQGFQQYEYYRQKYYFMCFFGLINF